MFNAVIASRNFGGTRSMPTRMPFTSEAIQGNLDALRTLLCSSDTLGSQTLGGKSAKGERVSIDAALFTASSVDVTAFLLEYCWLDGTKASLNRPAEIQLAIEFLQSEKHGIETWLILAPQLKDERWSALVLDGVPQLSVKKRSRTMGGSFGVFGEPHHRIVADCLADVISQTDPLLQPNAATSRLIRPKQGVFLLYPVRGIASDPITVGFELYFPQNSLPFDINFTVLSKGERNEVVVEGQI